MAQFPVPGGGTGGGGGVGAANAFATSAPAVTSLAIDVSALNLSALNVLLVQCWTGAAPPYSPVTVTSLNPATTSSVTANFVSTANVTCRANGNGGSGAPGATGATGATGPQGPAGSYSMATGTTLPATCVVGEAFFKSDAIAGQNMYGCTATNTWTQQAGGGGGTVTEGYGITVVGPTVSADTAVMQSRPTVQAGTTQYCRSTTGNATYICSLTPALTTYTRGGCLVLDADFSSVTTATLNVDTVGVKSILNRTGAALAAGDITANKPITICYDGTQFVIQGDGGGSSISVTGPYLTIGGTNYLGPAMYAVALPSAETWVDPDTSGGTFTSLAGGGRQLEAAANSTTIRNRSFDRGSNTTVELAWTAQGRPDAGDVSGMRAGLVIRETGSAASRLMVLDFPRMRDDSSAGGWNINGSCYSNSTTYASDFLSEQIPAQVMSIYYARLVLSGGNWTLSVSSTGLASTWVQFAQWSATACGFGAAGTHVGVAARNSSATSGSVYISLLSVAKS